MTSHVCIICAKCHNVPQCFRVQHDYWCHYESLMPHFGGNSIQLHWNRIFLLVALRCVAQNTGTHGGLLYFAQPNATRKKHGFLPISVTSTHQFCIYQQESGLFYTKCHNVPISHNVPPYILSIARNGSNYHLIA